MWVEVGDVSEGKINKGQSDVTDQSQSILIIPQHKHSEQLSCCELCNFLYQIKYLTGSTKK